MNNTYNESSERQKFLGELEPQLSVCVCVGGINSWIHLPDHRNVKHIPLKAADECFSDTQNESLFKPSLSSLHQSLTAARYVSLRYVSFLFKWSRQWLDS